MVVLPTFDSTKVSSLNLTPDQLGTSGSGVDWADASFPVSVTPTRDLGFSFNFGITNDSERGLALAPRIPFTTATDDLAGTGETATTWTLTLATTRTSLPLGTAILYGITSTAPSVWSGSANTPTLNIAATNTAYIIETFGLVDSAWVQNGSVFDMVFNFDFHTNYTQAVGGAAIERPQWSIFNNSLWGGLVQFIMTRDSTAISITGITFAGNAHDWHTGGMGMPKRRGRVVHDYITGQPYMSNIAVQDGYRDNVMVHPDNFDPSDPLEDSPFTPPPGEGITDDEIVDLE